MRVGRRERKQRRGAAAVEMATVLVPLLIFLFGIFEFGRAFQHWQVLTNATREGARVATLPGVTDDAVTSRVRTYLEAGSLTGFAYGVERKEALLKREGARS